MSKEIKTATWVLTIGCLILLIAPSIISLSSSIGKFDASTGAIGDTIGGITAPISNIIGAILVYLALIAQIKANEIIQKQISQEKIKETQRLLNIKKLILEDLNKNIYPSLEKLANEIPSFINYIKTTEATKGFDSHVLLSTDLYNSVSKTDLLQVFGDDFQLLIQIYSRVNFIIPRIPVKIVRLYPINDINLLLYKNIESKINDKIIERNFKRIEIELTDIKTEIIEKLKNQITYIVNKTYNN